MIDATKYTAHKHPGKFEGESPATEYFYEQMCNGDGETIHAGGDDDGEGGHSAGLFQIEVEEADAFGLPLHHWFLLREDSQGFAIGSVHATREEAEKAFNDWAGVDTRPAITCNQCEMLSINGVACHETGCPNARSRWDAESGAWVKQRECRECGQTVDADDMCCDAPCED